MQLSNIRPGYVVNMLAMALAMMSPDGCRIFQQLEATEVDLLQAPSYSGLSMKCS